MFLLLDYLSRIAFLKEFLICISSVIFAFCRCSIEILVPYNIIGGVKEGVYYAGINP